MANLTEYDKTRFLERGFAVVENSGRNLRLIKRDDPRQAISIKWDDLSALRELITLALDDGPMIVGLDVSGQSAKDARSTLAQKVLETVEAQMSYAMNTDGSARSKPADEFKIDIDAALRELFQREGIEVESKQ